MSEIVFYTNPQSRGRIVSWMLEELGEPYETRWIEYGEQMKGAEYLAINPMGKVPAITHGGSVVTECAAICSYLAASYPDKGLMPGPGPALAAFYRWMFFAAGPMEMAMMVKGFGWELTEDMRRSAGFGSIDSVTGAVASALADGPYICGEQFSAADVTVGSTLHWGTMFGTFEQRPEFAEYLQRLQERPAWQRSVQINDDRAAAQAGDQD